MKKKILVFILYLIGYISFSQETNFDFIAQINKNKYDVDQVQDYPKTISKLEILALNNDSSSQNWLGILYNEGLGVQKNESTAFELIQKAAKQGNTAAAYNLGRFYMIGTGCDIDFDKARYWLETAANQGNQRAAYALGYVAMKGFGVPQDYKTAVSWFTLSDFPMAKHWLGVCYYFGYGVPKDEDKAIVLLSQSNTPNSKMMLKHIAENVKQDVDSKLSKEINEKETSGSTAIAKEMIEETTQSINSGVSQTKKSFKPAYFNGQWKGKLIELDWSGKEIVRILPISLGFEIQNDLIEYKWELNNKPSQGKVLLEDYTLYFENLEMLLEMPYSHNPKSNTLLWQILSSKMEFKTINKKTYLIGNLETFSPEWQESGPPMRIVLKQTEVGEEDLTDDQLLAISNQNDQFIALYPNPFVNDLLIAYELETDARVNVNVYDFTGNVTPVTLEPGSLQTAGQHHYSLDGTNLKAGMYIVSVVAGNQKHSRIVIKK
jgi:TPR repeat protein